ncbi:hypothetical protein LINPERPRIM_LOCUS6728 [Linum perenne]
MIVCKCGKGSSNSNVLWDGRPASWSVWRWIVSESSCFWKFGLVDPGGVGSPFGMIIGCWWDIPLIGSLRGGAESKRRALFRLLDSLPEGVVSAGPLTLVWTLEPHGSFSVWSFARQLSGKSFGGLLDFPTDVIWCKQALSKVACFVWKMAHENISTIDNLRRRGLLLLIWCITCSLDAESIRHMFFECRFTYDLWSLLSSQLSLFGPFPSSTIGVLAAWKGWN